MRIILLEEPKAEWPPSMSTLTNYNKLNSIESQKNFLAKQILPHKKFRDLFGIRPIIIHSMLTGGIDPKINRFLQFIDKIPFKMPDSKNFRNKMQYVYDSFNNNKLNLTLPVLLNETLWTRSEADFRYALNAFNLFSQPRKVSNYLKSTKGVDVSQFMIGNKVKPSGQNGAAGDTIFNVIEGWAKDNEYSQDEINKNNEEESKNSGKYSIQEVLDEKKWSYEGFKTLIQEAFSSKSDYDIGLPELEDYLFVLFVIFKYPEILNNVDSYKGTQNLITEPLNSINDINDSLIKKYNYGDPSKVDVPIPLTVHIKNSKDTINGFYAFKMFTSLEDDNINELKSRSESLMRAFKNKKLIEDKKDRKKIIQGIIETIEDID